MKAFIINVRSMLTPVLEGDKSIGQKASDFTSGTGTGSGEQGQGVLAQAQQAVGNAAQSVQDTLGLNQGQNSGYLLPHVDEMQCTDFVAEPTQ